MPPTPPPASQPARPNVLFVFADQWRAQALGYAGDVNVKTPHLDRLAGECLQFTHAISGCPVCCPARASLLSGQHPDRHGVFLNDVQLDPGAATLPKSFAAAGYDTAYVGKWHVDGRGRSNYIPPERRQNFDYWKVLECTHDYNKSYYYAGNDPTKRTWEGYDAIAQTHDMCSYLRSRQAGDNPFFGVLSWGPPHEPYFTAPEEFRALYDPDQITLRPNVPVDGAEVARKRLAGYYAHCSALDWCMGQLLETLRATGLDRDTLLVFWSDHGDMMGSHGAYNKQRPWDESIRVPLLMRLPAARAVAPRSDDLLITTIDLMPTLLGFCGLPAPDTVQGKDLSPCLLNPTLPRPDAALIACYSPFGQWTRAQGGRELRGVRTHRHTYCRSLDGPWLLYDNQQDPYQLDNRVDDPSAAGLRSALDGRLQDALNAVGDEFVPGPEYIRRWGYKVDADGTVAFKW